MLSPNKLADVNVSEKSVIVSNRVLVYNFPCFFWLDVMTRRKVSSLLLGC